MTNGSYFAFHTVDWNNMGAATWETIWMTVVSMIAVAILGVLLGLLLFETTGSQNVGVKVLNWGVSFLVNVFRSVPFIILIMLLLPITKNLVGTIIGPTAALPSLIVSAAPFYARMVELAFHEIDRGVIARVNASAGIRRDRDDHFFDRLYRNGWCNRCRWFRELSLHRWVPGK